MSPCRSATAPRRAPLTPLIAVVAVISLGCASTSGPPPSAELTDEWISAEVWRLLDESEEVDADGVRVEAHDGVVVLSGTQSSVEQVREALRLAVRVRGVRQVVNHLRVIEASARSADRDAGASLSTRA